MSVAYNKDGDKMSVAYNVGGGELTRLFSVDGTPIEIDEDIPVTPMSWSMSGQYKSQVLSALEHIKAYRAGHPGSYAICQFNDVHEVFSGNEPNFIDYNKGYKVLSRMLFLGDMVDRAGADRFQNAVGYISGAQATPRIVGMGNHEYFYKTDATGNPEAIYKPLSTVDRIFFDDDFLIFYSDDTANKVRYIILDYFWITQTGADSGHLVDAAQLNWCAAVMEGAGDMDIIICAHSMMNPFTAVMTGVERSSSATLQNQQMLCDLINAFKNRGTYTVTVNGVAYEHDFSRATGDFVMYTSGHYHVLGHTDRDGFNMFTCPARKGTSAGTQKGFTFYLIDKLQKSIEVIVCAVDFSEYASFAYSY